MILKLRSMSFPLKPDCRIWIWLLLIASIYPSICAFDILLDQREFRSGPLSLNDDEATADNLEPFSIWRRNRGSDLAEEPLRRHLDATKYLGRIAKASANDVHSRANRYSPNAFARVPSMGTLVRDLAKWKQTKQIVKELRRRNNIPTWDKSWKKKHARNSIRSLRKQEGVFLDPSRSYRAAPSSHNPFHEALYQPRESGDEVFAGLVSTGKNSELADDRFLLDSAVGFEDFAVTPIKQIQPLQEFGEFTDDTDAPGNGRNLRQEGDFVEGEFDDNSNGCTDIKTRHCDSDSDCNCYGFYTCKSGQCQELEQRASAVSTTNGNAQTSGQWHDQPVVFV